MSRQYKKRHAGYRFESMRVGQVMELLFDTEEDLHLARAAAHSTGTRHTMTFRTRLHATVGGRFKLVATRVV